MKPIAIFRFSPTEGAGHFATFLESRRIPWVIVPLDAGAQVPRSPRHFSGIGMMGGPMSANDPLPWIVPLMDLVRGAVAADIPVIGHCLGGQLMARALGARVERAAEPEVGWHRVRLDDPAAREWFGEVDDFPTFQWHYDTFGIPPGARRLLTGEVCVNQAYEIGNAIGFQCHIEMTRTMVETWCREGARELEAPRGPAVQSAEEIMTGLDRRLAELSGVADRVYERWCGRLAAE